MSKWLEHWPVNWSVLGSTPGQRYIPELQVWSLTPLGHMQKATDKCDPLTLMFLYLSFPLTVPASLSFSLSINKWKNILGLGLIKQQQKDIYDNLFHFTVQILSFKCYSSWNISNPFLLIETQEIDCFLQTEGSL